MVLFALAPREAFGSFATEEIDNVVGNQGATRRTCYASLVVVVVVVIFLVIIVIKAAATPREEISRELGACVGMRMVGIRVADGYGTGARSERRKDGEGVCSDALKGPVDPEAFATTAGRRWWLGGLAVVVVLLVLVAKAGFEVVTAMEVAIAVVLSGGAEFTDRVDGWSAARGPRRRWEFGADRDG